MHHSFLCHLKENFKITIFLSYYFLQFTFFLVSFPKTQDNLQVMLEVASACVYASSGISDYNWKCQALVTDVEFPFASSASPKGSMWNTRIWRLLLCQYLKTFALLFWFTFLGISSCQFWELGVNLFLLKVTQDSARKKLDVQLSICLCRKMQVLLRN